MNFLTKREYRIIQEYSYYVVQSKVRFFPFWVTCGIHSHFGGNYHSFIKDAKEHIERLKNHSGGVYYEKT